MARRVNDTVYIFISARIYECKIKSITLKTTAALPETLHYEVEYRDFKGKRVVSKRLEEELYDSIEDVLDMIIDERCYALPEEEEDE